MINSEHAMQALKNAAFAPEGHIFDCFPQKPRISDGVTEDRVYRKVKAGDMLAGAWLSMNGTLGQWGRDVAGMVSEFGERTGNWVGGDGFKTDGEIAAVNAALAEFNKQNATNQGYQLVMTDAGYAKQYANGSYEFIDEVAAAAEMYKQYYGGDVTEAAYNQSARNKGFDYMNVETVEELQDDGRYKVTDYDKDGNPINEYYKTYDQVFSDGMVYGSRDYRATLFETGQIDEKLLQEDALALNQSRDNQYLRGELTDALGKIPNGSKYDVNTIIDNTCVAASLYNMLKNSGADVGSFGDFYANNVNGGYITPSNATITPEGRQNIVLQYQVNGNQIELSNTNNYNDYMSSDNALGVVRYTTPIGRDHNMNIYRSNGSWYMADTGWSRNNGQDPRKKVWPSNFKYYEYLKFK